MPRLRKKKRKSASQRQIFAFFPPTTSRFSVWTQLLGKKRASANQRFFFSKFSRISHCWLEEKKANICISQLKNGFYSSVLFRNYHWRPVWKKKSQMVEAHGRRVSQKGGGRGGVSDQWGACCGESPPPVASSEMRRHACPHPLPTVTPPSRLAVNHHRAVISLFLNLLPTSERVTCFTASSAP